MSNPEVIVSNQLYRSVQIVSGYISAVPSGFWRQHAFNQIVGHLILRNGVGEPEIVPLLGNLSGSLKDNIEFIGNVIQTASRVDLGVTMYRSILRGILDTVNDSELSDAEFRNLDRDCVFEILVLLLESEFYYVNQFHSQAKNYIIIKLVGTRLINHVQLFFIMVEMLLTSSPCCRNENCNLIMFRFRLFFC